jgi:oligoendopeptidase F
MRIPHLLIALLISVPGLAIAETYRIDPTAYFASPVDEATDRAALEADISALPVLTSPSPQDLLAYLRRAEALLAREQRHIAYLHLLSSRDIDDHAAADGHSTVQTDEGALVSKVRNTLRAVGKPGFDQAAQEVPALTHYGYVLDRAIRRLPHELPPEQQAILDDVSDQGSTALQNTYQKTRRATVYGSVHTSGGDLDAGKDADRLGTNPDRAVRQQAWQQKQAASAASAETYAALLIGIVRLNDKAAHLQHFADAPEAVYFSRQFDRADVDATARAVEQRASVLMDYQRLRASQIGRTANIADVHSWDLTLPPSGFKAPVFDYAQIRQIVPVALAPLGRDYVARFTALLDPATHRTDLAASPGNRVNDAFSIAAPGVPPGLFLGEWNSDLKGASVVAHEGGHALHSELMNAHGVSPFYNHGPSWMHEAIAILNEMLFYEHLYKQAPDASTRAYYLQAQLDEMTFEIFTSAEEAQLEESIYDGVIAGKVRKAADLDALTLATTSRFEIWPGIDPELKHAWIGKRLMFQDPLYLANYLYAGLLATKMFDMATSDPRDFQKRYEAMMTSGFDAPPKEILRRFFGRELRPSELVNADMDVIKGKTAALGKIYGK